MCMQSVPFNNLLMLEASTSWTIWADTLWKSQPVCTAQGHNNYNHTLTHRACSLATRSQWNRRRRVGAAAETNPHLEERPSGPALICLSSRVHVEVRDGDHQHITSVAPLYQILFIGIIWYHLVCSSPPKNLPNTGFITRLTTFGLRGSDSVL